MTKTKQTKTHPLSIRVALCIILRLVKLGVVPEYSWYKEHFGAPRPVNLYNEGMGQQRDFAFEWEGFPQSKITVKFTLYTPVHTRDPDEAHPVMDRHFWGLDEFPNLSRIWHPICLEITTPLASLKDGDGDHEMITLRLNDAESVRFFLNVGKS